LPRRADLTQRGGILTSAERFVRFATDCERMARFVRTRENELEWRRLAQRWFVICAIIRPKNISRAPRQPGKTTSDSRTRYASLSKRRLAKAQRTVPSLTAVASGQRGELDAQARTVILRGSRGRKFDPAVLHLKRQDRALIPRGIPARRLARFAPLTLHSLPLCKREKAAPSCKPYFTQF
jgi:hypothetical protein